MNPAGFTLASDEYAIGDQLRGSIRLVADETDNEVK